MKRHDNQVHKSLPLERNRYQVFFSNSKKVIFLSIGVLLLQSTGKNILQKIIGLVTSTHSQYSYDRIIRRRTQHAIYQYVRVAWLTSYPNSGTQFITDIVRKSTHFSTGTNYGNELNRQVGENYMFDPEFAMSDSGPYRSSSKVPMPKGAFLLTKTHCAGFCLECGPERYMKSESEFMIGCASGGRTRTEEERRDTGKPIKMVRYDVNLVEKTVHLIRNPYDNIVANFRYEYEAHIKQNDEKWTYTKDPKGFREWCRDLDGKYLEEEKKAYVSAVVEVAKDVPCHGLFYQYVQWHNNAVAITETLDIPRFDTYYEDYHYNIDKSVRRLVDFLEFSITEPQTVGFQWNGGYPNYYSDDERVIIANFIRLLSSYETYRLLKRYLDRKVLDSGNG